MDRSRVTASPPLSPYDRLAPHYRALSEPRAAYLAEVERFVVEAAPSPCRRYLDVGAGDGVRTRRIAAALGVSQYVMAEPSEGMVAEARRLGPPGETIWTCPAQMMPIDQGSFDLISCLWNVLGHVPDPSARIASLTRMGHLLTPGGRIVIDVNNRHNAGAYGRLRVAGRRVADAIWPDPRRGDVEVRWPVGGEVVTGQGHLFTPAELRGLVARAGLVILDELAIDYLSGHRSKRLTQGQLIVTIGRSRA